MHTYKTPFVVLLSGNFFFKNSVLRKNFFCGSIIRSCTYFYDFMGALGLLFSKLSAELTCSLSSIRIVWYNAGGCAWSLCSAFPLAVQCWASDDDGK